MLECALEALEIGYTPLFSELYAFTNSLKASIYLHPIAESNAGVFGPSLSQVNGPGRRMRGPKV